MIDQLDIKAVEGQVVLDSPSLAHFIVVSPEMARKMAIGILKKANEAEGRNPEFGTVGGLILALLEFDFSLNVFVAERLGSPNPNPRLVAPDRIKAVLL